MTTVTHTQHAGRMLSMKITAMARRRNIIILKCLTEYTVNLQTQPLSKTVLIWEGPERGTATEYCKNTKQLHADAWQSPTLARPAVPQDACIQWHPRITTSVKISCHGNIPRGIRKLISYWSSTAAVLPILRISYQPAIAKVNIS